MWGPRSEPPAVEKIRKAQWTVENTRATQAIVNKLVTCREALAVVGQQGYTTDAIDAAIERFKVLDAQVKA